MNNTQNQMNQDQKSVIEQQRLANQKNAVKEPATTKKEPLYSNEQAKPATKEFAPKSNIEVNPGRYNDDMKDETSVAKPDLKTGQSETSQSTKNTDNDSQAV